MSYDANEIVAYEQIRKLVQKGPVKLSPAEVVQAVRKLKEDAEKHPNLVQAAGRWFEDQQKGTGAKVPTCGGKGGSQQ